MITAANQGISPTTLMKPGADHSTENRIPKAPWANGQPLRENSFRGSPGPVRQRTSRRTLLSDHREGTGPPGPSQRSR